MRNQAYARKFRKRTNTGRYSRRRMDDRPEENDENKTGGAAAGSEGAADM
jgi:hypothetical protein